MFMSGGNKEKGQMQNSVLLSALAAGVVVSSASAELVGVVGGQTNVLLDFALIEGATGLALAGVSDGVIVPGNLGGGSVAFAITSPLSEDLPTSFMYDTGDFFGTFAGSIEHRGAVFFTGAADVALGNFTIGYDADVMAFQVSDNLDLGIDLFDVAITGASPLEMTFDVTGDLLISADFAALLIDLGLTKADLTGVDVGDAWVQALNQPVPAPGVLAFLGIAGVIGTRRRRG
jgi:hypothetical protein